MQWINIKDKKPTKACAYLTTDGEYISFGIWDFGIGSFEDLLTQDCADCDCKDCGKLFTPREYNVTHWIEIPEYPICKPKSRNINPLLKLKILKRDNYKCNHCDTSPAINPNVELQIDHIFPYSKGGSNDISNLQTLCRQCNYKKYDHIDTPA